MLGIFLILLSFQSDAQVALSRRAAILGTMALAALPKLRLPQTSQVWKHHSLRQDLTLEQATAIEKLEVVFAKLYKVSPQQIAENIDRLRNANIFNTPPRYSALGIDFEKQFILALDRIYPSLALNWLSTRVWLIDEGVNMGFKLETYYPSVSYKNLGEWRVQYWKQNRKLVGAISDLDLRQATAEQLTDFEFRFAKYFGLDIEQVFENEFYITNSLKFLTQRSREYQVFSPHELTVYRNYLDQVLPEIFMETLPRRKITSSRRIQIHNEPIQIKAPLGIQPAIVRDICKSLLQRTIGFAIDRPPETLMLNSPEETESLPEK